MCVYNNFLKNMNIRMWIIFVLGWGILVYIIAQKLHSTSDIEGSKTNKRISKIFSQLKNSNQRNMQILNFIEYYLNNSYKLEENLLQIKFIEKLEYQLDYVALVLNGKEDLNSFYGNIQLSQDYLQMRSRTKQNTEEMWNYFTSEIRKIRKISRITKETSEKMHLELGVEYKRSIISNIDRMRSVDGYEIWRQKENEIWSDLVQNRLYNIQNPKDCENAKKLLCQVKKCGLGCELHHLMYCLIIAYVSRRTLVLDSYDWNYHSGGWEEIFQPVSKTCTEYNMWSAEVWPGSKHAQLLMLQEVTSLVWKPRFLSLTVPKDLLPRIMKLNSNPSVWWLSQFAKYLFKPMRAEILSYRMEILDWKKPIVGVHIRRTDKNNEAQLFSVDKYMTFVEDYFLTLEIYKNVERRIYLATDDLKIITEVRTKYPHYKIIDDLNVAKAAKLSSRYTDYSLNGIIFDIHMLSLTDYLVCTFSSNICRLAYEIMQNYYPDASDRFKSLDYIYYLFEKNESNVEAILSHEARNKDEMSIMPGDVINVFGNNWNGFLRGNNWRTAENGIFPSFKVKAKIKIVSFPTYIDID